MLWSARFHLFMGVAGVCLACVPPSQPEVAATPEPVRDTLAVPDPDALRARPVPLLPPAKPVIDETVDRAPVPDPTPGLPPVPFVDSALSINVIYPSPNAIIASRDSNFILGSVGTGRAGLRIDGTLVPVWPNGAFMAWLPNPSRTQQYYEMVAYTAHDTVRRRYPVRTRDAIPPTPAKPVEVRKFSPPRVATLGNETLFKTVDDADHIIVGRPTPRGTYGWFFLPRTPVRIVQYRGDMAQVQLDRNRLVWIARRDIQPIPAGQRAPEVRQPITNRITVDSTDEWIDVVIPLASPAPYHVTQRERGFTLTLYNVRSTQAVAPNPVMDALVSGISLERSASRSYVRVSLTRPVYGYLVLYENDAMIFRIRRPPHPIPDAPLRGLTIAVDAGHPPAGTTGPTGLYEAIPNLAVALKVRDMLEAKGATVVMTRETDDTVHLGDRPIMARKANANALVSIHLNAVPDGTNPFRAAGTGTYYFWPHAKALAEEVQASLVPELKLRDLGVFHANLALARPTWMPSVLAEGLFLIVPEQEAAIRTPEYQAAYARGIVSGLERYFETLIQ